MGVVWLAAWCAYLLTTGVFVGYGVDVWARNGHRELAPSRAGAVVVILMVGTLWLPFSIYVLFEKMQKATPRLAHRWSDRDRKWWRFTYANEGKGRDKDERRQLGIILASGDDDDYPGCILRLHLLGRTLIVALPPIIKPQREWIDTSQHKWASAVGGYWDIRPRDYGFMVQGDYVHVYHGVQTGDSSTQKSTLYAIPWRQWRFIRYSLYGLEGETIWTQPALDRAGAGCAGFERQRIAETATPKVTFDFLDYDKERLTATTFICEREWRLGEGCFKWLSRFAKPMVRRSLDIRFSGETGKRKGSWKGGTIGAGIDMLPGELHEKAFARYAKHNGMTFPIPWANADKVEGTRGCITDKHIATGMQSGSAAAVIDGVAYTYSRNPVSANYEQDAATCRDDEEYAIGVGMLIAGAASIPLWIVIFAFVWWLWPW